MSITDRLYTEWAWRTKSGLPDFNNPNDRRILDSLISELSKDSVIVEQAPGYDEYFKQNGFETIDDFLELSITDLYILEYTTKDVSELKTTNAVENEKYGL